jgi:hypothetical protein
VSALTALLKMDPRTQGKPVDNDQEVSFTYTLLDESARENFITIRHLINPIFLVISELRYFFISQNFQKKINWPLFFSQYLIGWSVPKYNLHNI